MMSNSKTVTVFYMGIPHYYAVCQDCEWTYEDARHRRKGQQEIRKHVAKTGHTVDLEKAVVTRYSPAD